MLRILGRRTSGNVMKPLWVVDELGLEYEREDIGGKFGGNREPGYLVMNPTGLVPTLVEDDFVLWESNAITRYLCEKYGHGTLFPADPRVRATADTWMDWQQTTCAPMMLPVFWGLVRTPEAERDYDRINAGIERGYEVWGMLDRHLEGRPFVAGDDLTMGDIPIGPQAPSLVQPRRRAPVDAEPGGLVPAPYRAPRVPQERDDPHRIGRAPCLLRAAA